MGTITLSKTIGVSLIAWADLVTTGQTISAVQSVATALAASFNIQLGRRSGTAFTAGWPTIRIEASGKASGNDKWIPLLNLSPDVGASIANTTLNGAVSIGATSCVVTSATNIVAGDYLFLGHTTTPANYELVRAKSLSGTTVNFEEACTRAHDNGAAVTDQAMSWFPTLSMEGYSRVRVVEDNANSGQTIAVEVLMNTLDSLTT